MNHQKTSLRIHSLFFILIVFLLVYATAFVTSMFKADSWYANLRKPMLSPSENIFLFSWYPFFFLLGISIILLWRSKQDRPHILVLFGTHFLLTILWSIFFFGIHQPILAFFELLLLVALTVGILITAYSIRKISAVPVLLSFGWLIFLLYLNYQIAFMF